jgi:hypothetical protein
MNAVCLAGIVAAVLSTPQSAVQEKRTYAPQMTKVAVIPTVNLSGEKDEAQAESQRASGDKALRELFGRRGFTLVPEEIVVEALAQMKVDTKDEEQHRRAVLMDIGKRCGADLVAFAVVKHVTQHLHRGWWVDRRQGRAQVKLWVLDVPTSQPLVSGVTTEGESGGAFFAEFDKGSARMVLAVANAIRDTLLGKNRKKPTGFLADYPEIATGAKTGPAP